MYKYIINPLNGQKEKIDSNSGKLVLNHFLKNIKTSRYNNMNGGSLPQMNLVYMAKPGYGGWVTFTTHMNLKYNAPVYKIGNRTENKKRDYGYGVQYQNMHIDEIIKMPNLVITAIDKNYYKYLDKFPDGTVIVIHDPTEIKGKSCQPVIDSLARFRVVTIRETVHELLKSEQFDIKNQFMKHPFYEFPLKTNKNKDKAVSISRVDYDKHTEIILEANTKLDTKIDIYGAKNDLYVYRKLKDMNLDTMDEKDPNSAYRGRFTKSFDMLSDILSEAKYVVDMSAIYKDGGGSQYTFLEAIYAGAVLVISDKWVDGKKTEYKDGVNCIVVSNSDELVEVVNSGQSIKKIVDNAKKLLKPHIDVDWRKLF